MSDRIADVTTLLPQFHHYRDTHPAGLVGGNLHVVLDDLNLEDGYIEECIRFAEEEGDTEGAELGRIMLRLSMTQRRNLARMFYS
jgi:hypothetical protein